MLAFVGIWLTSSGNAWLVTMLGWILIVAGVGIAGWAWNRRDRGEDDTKAGSEIDLICKLHGRPQSFVVGR